MNKTETDTEFLDDENLAPEVEPDEFSWELTDEEMIEFLEAGESHRGLEETDELLEYLEVAESDEELALLMRSRPKYNAAYRGWYGTKSKPRWCPQQSKYGGRGGSHKGADLFAKSGTTLPALVAGGFEWRGSKGKWGNHLFLNFKQKSKNYTFVYAHLGSAIGQSPRRVKMGEAIAKSGCTGNTVYCGSRNNCGGLEDHLHLELFGPSGRMDPIAFLRWNVRHASDRRCFYPNC